ncbi:MAG TPA: TetR/AcrR family transcriptional regulator [Acidimicrobiales bacterium]|nr:TetR/AcrR family transcriptional regulator [Acidimicrobiales bacterium]
MSPRQPDPRVRLQLVEAAARLLYEQGLDAVTARRLATEVGASTQVLYTHFEGVDDVVAEVWREGFRRFGAALDEPAVTDDPVADFITQGWGYRRFALANPHLYRVMFGDGLLSMRHGREDDLGAAAGTFLSLLSRIERCRDAQRWTVDDLFTAGEVVWATSHGHVSIEMAGYYEGVGRDPEVTFVECLRRLGLGFGDDPALVATSLRTARRRARRADAR